MDAAVPAHNLRNTMAGFGVAAAFFGGIIGYLIGATVGGAIGAAVGALVGAALALLALQPRAHDAPEAIAHGEHPNYMIIWLVLFVLMMTKVGVAFLAFSKLAIITVLLALAASKALLVALYYMHLKFEPRRMWALAAVPLPLAVILLFALLY